MSLKRIEDIIIWILLGLLVIIWIIYEEASWEEANEKTLESGELNLYPKEDLGKQKHLDQTQFKESFQK